MFGQFLVVAADIVIVFVVVVDAAAAAVVVIVAAAAGTHPRRWRFFHFLRVVVNRNMCLPVFLEAG